MGTAEMDCLGLNECTRDDLHGNREKKKISYEAYISEHHKMKRSF